MPTTEITLPTGTEPVPDDLVLMSQGGTTTVVTFSQFLAGLPGVADIDASQMLVTPTGSTTSSTLANFAAETLPLSGGTMTGPLTLSANPTTALQAATKQYVDSSPGSITGVINVKSPPYNAQLNGTTNDTAAFSAAYQAAPAGSVIYVPNGVTVLNQPSTWGVTLTKWVKWIVDGTTLPDGTSLADAIPGGTGPAELVLPGVTEGNSSGNSGFSVEASQGSSQPTDFAVSRSAYIVNHTGGTAGVVSANSRVDTIIYNSPYNDIWGGLDRLLWSGVQTGSASDPSQHVARYIQVIRQSGTVVPQPQMWGAAIEYRDTTAELSSITNAGITCEMDWFGNGPDDGKNRQIQSLVVGQNNPYHIISDGESSWREVFRTNSVNPRFGGPPVLPSYTVAGLPSALIAGAAAFASNGRKPSEGAGAGPGVQVFCDGTNWISVCSGSPVEA